MGLADLHIHTIYSYDGTSSVSAVIKYAAHHAKLDVIAITDHNKIEGALQAQDLAPSYNIEVIPGIEVSSEEGHILALFVSRPIPPGLSIEATVLKTLEQGGICIIPHPMTYSRMAVHPYAIQRALRNPEVSRGLVGVEFFNAGMAGAQRDERAIYLCSQLPISQVGCSDAHVNWMIGLGATRFPGRSAAELRRALENHQTQAVGTDQMEMGDFIIRYVPRLALRHAGWVPWNENPSEPLRMTWRGNRKFRQELRYAQSHPGLSA
ncbi:MAG: PHP domain-containing protein [Chloroflexota bacterium]